MGKVTVTINKKTSDMTVAVEGVMGGGCKTITDALLADKKVLDSQLTGEYCEVQERPDYIENLDGGGNTNE